MVRFIAIVVLCTVTCAEAGQIALEHVAGGFSQPVFATYAPGDNDRLFVVELGGDVRIIDRNTSAVLATPYLDLDQPASGSMSLVGFTFHPDFQTNGKMYTHRVMNVPGSKSFLISEFTVTSSTDSTASVVTERTILSEELYDNGHNAGWIGFSPNDGYLYIATGDNGRFSTADPPNHGQRTDELHASILRIDVDNQDPGLEYAIPSSNPFVGVAGSRDEIWAYGLRNPWRNSFDRDTGDFYITDVGWNSEEEINFHLYDPDDEDEDRNYGWRIREGSGPTPGFDGILPGAIDPLYSYPHEDVGLSVTGGYVYRGPLEELQGQYFFADYVQGWVKSLEHDGTNVTAVHDWTEILGLESDPFNIVSFGEDNLGNLYIVDIAGDVYMLTSIPEPAAASVLAAGLIVLSFKHRRLR